MIKFQYNKHRYGICIKFAHQYAIKNQNKLSKYSKINKYVLCYFLIFTLTQYYNGL